MSKGIVYLLHFERHYKRARHYLGWTNDKDRRLDEHLNGKGGSPLTKAVYEAGIRIFLAQTWEGGRTLERSIKNRKKVRLLCPICKQEDGEGR